MTKSESATQDNIITLELFGQQYSFKADNNVSNAKEVADLLINEVDNVKNQIMNKATKMDKFTILTLAALNISNEYISLKQTHSDLLEKISKRSASLVRTIDLNLK